MIIRMVRGNKTRKYNSFGRRDRWGWILNGVVIGVLLGVELLDELGVLLGMGSFMGSEIGIGDVVIFEILLVLGSLWIIALWVVLEFEK